MDIRMKTSDSQPGWLIDVMGSGCRVSHRPEAFGRTSWLVKKDGEAISVLQGQNTGLTTTIANPTAKQREIAAALASSGIAAVTGE